MFGGYKMKSKLYKAAQKGDLLKVKHLITEGADVNAKRNDGWTALILASRNGHKEVAQLLLAKGADVNLKTNNGVTALMYASIGHKEIVQALLDKGADVNETDEGGSTALMMASYGYKEVVELLLANGADVNAHNEYGNTALMSASEGGHKEVVELLLAKGADINAKRNSHANALMIASNNGHKEVVQLLKKAGTVNEDLIEAAKRGDLSAVKHFIANGAYVNAHNEFTSPLEIASLKGHLEVVRALIDKGAYVNETDERGGTALYLASLNGHKEIVELLSRSGMKDIKQLGGKEERWKDLYARLMANETFGITLTCPDCRSPLDGYRCLRCVNQHKNDNKLDAVDIIGHGLQGWLKILSYCMPVFAGGIGFMAFGRLGGGIGVFIGISMAGMVLRDLNRESTQKASVHAAELLLAQRYQDSPETYDQAAVCYINWFKTHNVSGCPPGLELFLTCYKNLPDINRGVFNSLLDVAFVKTCAVWGEGSQLSNLHKTLTITSNHSENQKAAVRAIKIYERDASRRGQNTTSLRFLIANFDRLGY
jgi:ankyrin repeat protein